MAAVLAMVVPGKGLVAATGHGPVVDWGYVATGGSDPTQPFPVDLCMNALLVRALDAMVMWCGAVRPPAPASVYSAALAELTRLLHGYLGLTLTLTLNLNLNLTLILTLTQT